MELQNATVLITGANRGLGRHFAAQALERGAARVYATARRPETIDLDGVVPLALDVTDPDAARRAAELAPDVDVLVNNAGIATYTDPLSGDPDLFRAELDVHLWGTWSMLRTFAPVLARRGGGGVLNVLSALSFRVFPGSGAYAVAKTAAWALTNSARLELRDQGTQVTAVHYAATDTDMMAGYDGPKTDAALAVRRGLDGFEAGDLEVLADADTQEVKSALAQPPEVLYAPFL